MEPYRQTAVCVRLHMPRHAVLGGQGMGPGQLVRMATQGSGTEQDGGQAQGMRPPPPCPAHLSEARGMDLLPLPTLGHYNGFYNRGVGVFLSILLSYPLSIPSMTRLLSLRTLLGMFHALASIMDYLAMFHA